MQERITRVKISAGINGDNNMCGGNRAIFENSTVCEFNGNCYWWLRSIGSSKKGTFVDVGGRLSGGNITNKNTAVRPALWVDLSNIRYIVGMG